MTQNQIAYWKNVETERANREQENLKRRELTEKERSNLASEAIANYEAVTKAQRVKDQKEAEDANELIDMLTNWFIGPISGAVTKGLLG